MDAGGCNRERGLTVCAPALSLDARPSLNVADATSTNEKPTAPRTNVAARPGLEATVPHGMTTPSSTAGITPSATTARSKAAPPLPSVWTTQPRRAVPATHCSGSQRTTEQRASSATQPRATTTSRPTSLASVSPRRDMPEIPDFFHGGASQDRFVSLIFVRTEPRRFWDGQ